jgi:hypothetical protein
LRSSICLGRTTNTSSATGGNSATRGTTCQRFWRVFLTFSTFGRMITRQYG